MKGISLSYEEKRKCSRDRFCAYIELITHFDLEQKNYLQKVIVSNKISGILYVTAVLAGWSFMAAWIDAILIPGATLFSLLKGEVSYTAFAFPASFLVGNALFKFFYIWKNLHGKIAVKDNFIAVIPYVGSIYLLREYLVKDPLMTQAVKLFLNEQKNAIKRKMIKPFIS
jgi:hypothetical protein